jgi:hypothetical protein
VYELKIKSLTSKPVTKSLPDIERAASALASRLAGPGATLEIKTMEIAIQANAGSYAIYGAALLDLYRTETGLSYPRLATTLYGIGFTLPRAWHASREVEAGKALVVVGEAAGYPSEGRFDDVRGLLETELEAQVVEIR